MYLCVYHQMVWGPGPSYFTQLHVCVRFVHPSHGCLLIRLCPRTVGMEGLVCHSDSAGFYHVKVGTWRLLSRRVLGCDGF